MMFLIIFFLKQSFYRWYFGMISVSGVFSVTFSVIFAYVADFTQEHERSTAYGWVRWWTFCLFVLKQKQVGQVYFKLGIFLS